MKKFLFIPILCMALILPGIRTHAADPNAVNYCEKCAAALIWGSGSSSNYTTVHYLPTVYVDANKQPIYEACTIRHVVTGVGKACPNGHGVKWSATCHEEYHSSDKCGFKKYYE